ncbi:MAG: RpiB/LacA/LacB family sugar-phosphate isomerase [bacterium]|nr:RpiB/LacA/LacB family sugar-phosphate isomerase [bacterium]
MKIFIGADHRGYNLKESLRAKLLKEGNEVIDMGGSGDPADDYPDFAEKVGEAVSKDSEAKGILICGSGVGVLIAANKIKGVRASLIFEPKQGRDARADEDPNVLTLSADYTTEEKARQIVDAWLSTPFSGVERHARRVGKIAAIEQKNFR